MQSESCCLFAGNKWERLRPAPSSCWRRCYQEPACGPHRPKLSAIHRPGRFCTAARMAGWEVESANLENRVIWRPWKYTVWEQPRIPLSFWTRRLPCLWQGRNIIVHFKLPQISWCFWQSSFMQYSNNQHELVEGCTCIRNVSSYDAFIKSKGWTLLLLYKSKIESSWGGIWQL